MAMRVARAVLLTGAVWLAGAFRTTISWRDKRLRIGAGSVLAPAHEEAPLEAMA